MLKTASVSTFFHTRALRQALALLLLGIICLLIAWLLHPTYPIGVLVLGLGMLVAVLFNPHRLVIAASLVTAVGLAVFLFFSHALPGNQVLSSYIVAIGIGLLAIAFATRRGYVGAGAVSPALIVLLVGVVEALLAANLTPPGFISFMLSFWLPGLGLLVLGLIYLFANWREVFS
ncbi:MAG TPA: hypothetical protein VH593_05460 [Ktedonobacteraceae bacterium]